MGRKKGSKNKPSKTPTLRSQQATIIAAAKQAGASNYQACRAAGLSHSYSRSFAHKKVNSLQVREAGEALAKLGENISNAELGNMAKARLHQRLAKPPKDARVAGQDIRTGLEVGNHIGGSSELHLHQHQQVPDVRRAPITVKAMYAEKWLELFRKEDTTDEEVKDALEKTLGLAVLVAGDKILLTDGRQSIRPGDHCTIEAMQGSRTIEGTAPEVK